MLATARARCACVGFTGGEHHAGTVRARIVDGRVELCAEAWLGGAVLAAGRVARAALGHDRARRRRVGAAGGVGRRGSARAAGARVDAPFIVGWCSWYEYFERRERARRPRQPRARRRVALRRVPARRRLPARDRRLARHQRAVPVGRRRASRPRSPRRVARPGSGSRRSSPRPTASVARRHPEWLARAPEGDGFAIGMYNEAWGGVMAELDTTRPEVLDHLAATAAALVERRVPVSRSSTSRSRPRCPGRYADPTRTPAERVRAGYDAVRRGAGDDVFVVGCGAPIGAVVGSVDAMRIGADVAPWWTAPPGQGELQPGYEETTPATRNAFVNTCTRSFMHRRLWSNDPDCVMLRDDGTQLLGGRGARRGARPSAARAGSCSSPTTSRGSGPTRGACSTTSSSAAARPTPRHAPAGRRVATVSSTRRARPVSRARRKRARRRGRLVISGSGRGSRRRPPACLRCRSRAGQREFQRRAPPALERE